MFVETQLEGTLRIDVCKASDDYIYLKVSFVDPTGTVLASWPEVWLERGGSWSLEHVTLPARIGTDGGHVGSIASETTIQGG